MRQTSSVLTNFDIPRVLYGNGTMWRLHESEFNHRTRLAGALIMM